MLRSDADFIIHHAISAVLPHSAVKQALQTRDFGDRPITLVSIGKAAWDMAYTAYLSLGNRIRQGTVITKHHHSKGPIGHLHIFEAGHPVPDESSFRSTRFALDMIKNLTADDVVLFLVSGGGSALFEHPLIPKEEFASLTEELLRSGADIVETNIIRKRFSAVKGGRFAQLCSPASVVSVILSDIIGDPIDMIASGPACPDSSTCEDALRIFRKYNLTLTPSMEDCLRTETPKELNNVETHITGSVSQLCQAAADACRSLGYDPVILTSCLSCTARDAGVFLSNIARHHQNSTRSLAFLAGGETTVHVTGTGLGGRNQELALAAAPGLSGLKNTAIFSIGSDGTDGPTDAAGGYVDTNTLLSLKHLGVDCFDSLQNNDAYHALEHCGGLIKTGPTGTNVNDVAVVLIRR